jgi:Zn-dependent M28 family amino/carboxypeptidase
VACENIVATVAGGDRKDEIIVVGAHYDSTVGSPAANDNASGVASLLAMAEIFNRTRPSRTVRFVAFTNEELAFQTPHMGSLVYAQRCKAHHDNVVGMIALDTVGMYTDRPASQTYPMEALRWLFPATGNFVSFVGNPASRPWLTHVVGHFRETAHLPSEGAAVPELVAGSSWSDHWAFWQQGYPAILVSDTAPFRDATYHTGQDKPDHLNYVALARLSLGLEAAIAKLAE